MKRLIVLSVAALVLSACGGGSTEANTSRYASDHKIAEAPVPLFKRTEVFSFDTQVLADTLVMKGRIQFYGSWSRSRESAYLIRNENDLELFNQTVLDAEQIALEGLETYTYFLIRGPFCPNYYEIAESSYQSSAFTITLKLFALLDAVCPAVVMDEFTVLRAEKYVR